MRFFIVFLCSAISAFGGVIYVDSDASSGGDGASWETAFNYLQDAIQVANSESEIWIAEGTYYPEDGVGFVDKDRNARFEMIDGLKLYGGFTGTETSLEDRGPWQEHPTILSGKVGIYGQWSYSLLYFPTGATAYLDGLTILGATSTAVKSASSTSSAYSVHLSNCRFTENSGGIAQGGTWYVRFSIFDRNEATSTANATIADGGTWYVENSVFYRNQSTGRSAVANSGTWRVNNSIFVENAARASSGIYTGVAYQGEWTVHNCTFYKNEGESGTNGYNLALGGSWRLFNSIIHSSGRAFSGTSIKTYTDLLLTSYTEKAENIIFDSYYADPDPMFVNADDPVGPDGLWFTDDDGLRLLSTSPAIGIGSTTLLQYDYQDIDEDGDIIEKLPIDATGMDRLQGGFLDLGAYAFDRSLPYRLIVTSSTGGLSNNDGVSFWAENDIVTLNASPFPGYIFEKWSGASTETTPSVTLSMDSDKTIQAHFIPDLADDDGDSLSNYDEEVIHGTDPDNADTSGDGFSDAVLITLGLDPRLDYSPILSQIDYASLGYSLDTDGNGLSDTFESAPDAEALAQLGYYTLDSFTDARSGSVMLQKASSGKFLLHLQIERSTDLQNWTRSQSDLVTVEVEAPSDKEFLRFAFE